MRIHLGEGRYEGALSCYQLLLPDELSERQP